MYKLTKIKTILPEEIGKKYEMYGDGTCVDRENTKTSKWIDYIYDRYMIVYYNISRRKLYNVYYDIYQNEKLTTKILVNLQVDFNKLFPEGCFIRLDNCSPKDSEINFPIKDTNDIEKCINTSSRAQDYINTLYLYDTITPIYLIPYNKFMSENKKYEFRVFVCDGQITAISSYYTGYEYLDIIKLISIEDNYPLEENFNIKNMFDKCCELYKKFYTKYFDPNKISSMRKYNIKGIIFPSIVIDMFLMPRHETIIEINPFGKTTRTSSCLFSWEDDYNQLYGQNNKIEIRIKY